MRYFFFIALVLSFCCCYQVPVPEPPCPTCPMFSFCLADTCKCGSIDDVMVNKQWCADTSGFVARFDDWYCIDTFTMRLEIPSSLPATGVLATGRVEVSNRRMGVGEISYSQQILLYYRRPDGDSIELYAIPTSLGGNTKHCVVDDGACEVDVFGKFRSADTIDAVLRLRCFPQNTPAHGDEHRIMFVRLK